MPRASLRELQIIKDTVRSATLGRVPRTPSKTSDANFDLVFVENAVFYTDP